MAPTNIEEFYREVIKDVINNVRSRLVSMGVDEQVLVELQETWESKLMSTQVLHGVNINQSDGNNYTQHTNNNNLNTTHTTTHENYYPYTYGHSVGTNKMGNRIAMNNIRGQMHYNETGQQTPGHPYIQGSGGNIPIHSQRIIGRMAPHPVMINPHEKDNGAHIYPGIYQQNGMGQASIIRPHDQYPDQQPIIPHSSECNSMKSIYPIHVDHQRMYNGNNIRQGYPERHNVIVDNTAKGTVSKQSKLHPQQSTNSGPILPPTPGKISTSSSIQTPKQEKGQPHKTEKHITVEQAPQEQMERSKVDSHETPSIAVESPNKYTSTSGSTTHQQGIQKAKEKAPAKRNKEIAISDQDILDIIEGKVPQLDGDGSNEYDELGSDDDDSDDNSFAECEDKVTCQYEKVTRTKSQSDKVYRAKIKWKCNFKDGIIKIRNIEHVFNRGMGELEWA